MRNNSGCVNCLFFVSNIGHNFLSLSFALHFYIFLIELQLLIFQLSRQLSLSKELCFPILFALALYNENLCCYISQNSDNCIKKCAKCKLIKNKEKGLRAITLPLQSWKRDNFMGILNIVRNNMLPQKIISHFWRTNTIFADFNQI